MSANLNRFQCLGNLGQDVELRYTQNQMAVTNLNVATNETRTDQQGQQQTKTTWWRVTVWGKMAENCQKYLRKGSSVFIEGRVENKQWTDQQQVVHHSYDFVASSVQFLDRPQQGQGQQPQQPQQQPMQQQQGYPQQQQQYPPQQQYQQPMQQQQPPMQQPPQGQYPPQQQPQQMGYPQQQPPAPQNPAPPRGAQPQRPAQPPAMPEQPQFAADSEVPF